MEILNINLNHFKKKNLFLIKNNNVERIFCMKTDFD